MAPIRRYLRISKYSVLECRIYLDTPSDRGWLLNPRDPVLPRVFETIRPLVLPKLREENERLWMRKKSKPVKDVISEDDFEVAIFLRESRTRHSLLTRQKTFHQSGARGETNTLAKSAKGLVDSAAGPANLADPEVIIESDEEAAVDLHNIPQEAEGDMTPEESISSSRRSKRGAETAQVEEEDLAVDEKKLQFSTHYESFNICGWVLCLLITRKGGPGRPNTGTEPKQPLLEEWISTQAQTTMDED